MINLLIPVVPAVKFAGVLERVVVNIFSTLLRRTHQLLQYVRLNVNRIDLLQLEYHRFSHLHKLN
jgi:hypothetical protein